MCVVKQTSCDGGAVNARRAQVSCATTKLETGVSIQVAYQNNNNKQL